ncbi:MAG: EAL domain-containing protein [Phreatobacter sp.]|uniref:putative bifunctional diguanylate cyclase/phosphodiesterase n=1 Tax=Phreatobacter sp. TaxID=1966341 RepID=UPI0027333129|nr:EAL domain-containing protein [Phreatobacter sp.]MDP2803716.1 EAL domain-containing protein [Phreatobacter sp.]
MIALIAIGVGTVWLYVPQAMQAAAIDAAHRSNIDVAEQIKITRGYYTQNVVAKATAAGTLNPTAIHAGDPNAIPLPATFVQDISNLLTQRATSLALVSPYPWPHRADRTMDDFQRRAWEIFRHDPDRIISATEVRNGQRVLRVAISDRMTNEACVACHNTDAYSPRHDWKIGDVRAVMEVKRVIEPYLAAADQRSQRIILGVAGTAFLVILLMTAIAMAVARSMRSKQEVDRHVVFLAHHDAMTGALNRSRFVSLLTDVIAQSKKAGVSADVALFYVDVDRFKEVNDRLGHAAGDQLIKAVVARLRERLRDDDMIGRVGGDEFVIARIRDVDAADAMALAEAIVADVAMPFALARHTLSVSASVGVRIGAGEVEDMMRAADVALYHAKSLGRSQAVLFSEDMQEELEARRHLEQTIRDTSRDCRFELHFQPLLSANDRRLHGFEALLRLPDGKGGYIPPVQFIRVAEEIGMIGTIGAWALGEACRAAARWPDHLTVAVNLSPLQFASRQGSDASIVDVVADALTRSGLAPHRLELEVTESVLLESSEVVIGELHALKSLGTTLVLDDFGTGYSSLSYLWKLPFDRLKIDQSFVAALREESRPSLQVVRTIMALSHALSMKVTAEGVETDEQASLLTELGCGQLQGYLFGRPSPEADLAGLVLADFQAGQAPVKPRRADRPGLTVSA